MILNSPPYPRPLQTILKTVIPLLTLTILTGCLDLNMDLYVQPDGAAKLDLSSKLASRQSDPMMDRLLKYHPKAKASPKVLMSRKSTWEAMAEQLGTRITLEDYQSETQADGTLATQARFDVPDIRSLKLGMMVAAIPLKPYGLAPQNWNFRFLRPPNQQAYTLLSPNPRPSPQAKSARDVLGPIADLPITERWIKDLLRSACITIRIHHEPESITSSAQQLENGSFDLFRIDVQRLIAAGALPELLQVTELKELRSMNDRGVDGIWMQEAAPIKTQW